MFWDKAANFYDLFENWYNGEVNKKLAIEVSDLIDKKDNVLECACGTGMLSKGIAAKCNKLIATDFSDGMLKQASKNCAEFHNTTIKKANIMNLEYEDETFDKVVAGNVIHLLDEPYIALDELMRVCKKGGLVIIPTYINNENAGKPSLFIQCLEKFGADFKKQFSFLTYKEFFAKANVNNIDYIVVSGKMPCAIAIITRE